MSAVHPSNIVIVIADDLRADVVEDPLVRTPNLDALAADGVTFAQNFATIPVCAPSRIANFTGLYPQAEGHRSLYQLLRPEEQNLFKLLRENGYQVVMTGKNDLMNSETLTYSFDRRLASQESINLDIVHERVQTLPLGKRAELAWLLFRLGRIEHKSPQAILSDPRMGAFSDLIPAERNPFPPGHRLHHAFYFGRTEGGDPSAQMDERIIASAIRYLRSSPLEPFCLFVATTLPHTPYRVEEPYFSMYDRNAIPDPIPARLEDKPHFMRELYRLYGMEGLTPEDYREMRATYYGMVSKLDALVGELVTALKERGVYEDSLILFLSDHGDYAGDYGLPEKWPNGFQDALIRAPLLVKFPQNAHAGQRVSEFTQSIDLFPTVLDAARVHTPYTFFGQPLLPLVEGQAGRQAVFAVGGYDPREPQCFESGVDSPDDPFMGHYYEKIRLQHDDPTSVARSAMVRTRDWKLVVRSAGLGELYDLRNDPQELHNQIGELSLEPVRQELKDQLLLWYLRTSDNPHWEHERSV
jgi:choline-sulfatase